MSAGAWLTSCSQCPTGHYRSTDSQLFVCETCGHEIDAYADLMLDPGEAWIVADGYLAVVAEDGCPACGVAQPGYVVIDARNGHEVCPGCGHDYSPAETVARMRALS